MAIVSPDTPLYNSRIFNSYLQLLKEKYRSVSIQELLSHAGMQEAEVADPGHWFSQSQVDRFHEKLVQLSGNPNIAREAGRYIAAPGVSGLLRDVVLGLAGPEHFFTLLNRVAANFTRSCSCSTRKLGPRELEVTITFEEGVRENPRQCDNRIGCFEAAFLMFGYRLPEIHHEECVFRGGRVCRYRISWHPSPAERLTLLRRLSLVLLLVLALCAAWLTPATLSGALFLAVSLGYLSLVVWIQRLERGALLTSLRGLRESSEAQLEQIKGNYDSALMVNEIGEAIASLTDLDQILAGVSQVLVKRLNYGRGVVLLANRDRSALVLRSSFGLDPAALETLELLEHPIDGSARPFVRCFREQSYLLVRDLAEVVPQVNPDRFAFLASMGVKSFICAPLVCEGESLGVLAVDDFRREGELAQRDLDLMKGVAPVIGIAVRNAMRLANERDLSEQLRKFSGQLERRVTERTAELRRATEELEFLYDSVSHDLRSPLRVIYGYGELLLDGYADRLDDTAREYLDAMIRGGEQMEETLDRMLDFSEVRHRELSLEPVDLSEMARRILKDLTVTDPLREVCFSVAEGVEVTGDPRLLTSVMENLLGNAWKFSAGKKVSEISFGVRDGALFVSDNGDGFDMAHSDRLFLPFQRLHDRSDFAGHGLGLSMVRTMVERMGGRVWGEGIPGAGATFYFTVAT